MHLGLVLATTKRVLRQLSHDKRTLGLLFAVPIVLLGLLAWMYSDNDVMFDFIGPPLLGIFPFITMFLVTSITMQRERTGGTLERLLATRIGKLDILLGYAKAFGLLAIMQALLASLAAVYLYGLDVAGPLWALLAIALCDALLGAALGLFASAFARSEFQAVQFMPAIILPQLLLCGLLVPVSQLPDVLHVAANALPLTYAVEAMSLVAKHASLPNEFYQDVAVVLGFATVSIMLGAATLRRRSK
ncbi:MAG TPA: ABC transporter permease [Candidatus Saccharimonadales bacterium]|nr:ABC transporter permease [Candidatus Saccharimonadales bacterium]